MTTTTTQSTVSLPSAKVSLALVYAGCVLTPVAVFAANILFTDEDPYRAEGPVDSIISIAVVSTVALAVGLGLIAALGRTPQRSRIAALVLGALSVVTVVFFWSGAPGILGVCAAWAAGLTGGRQPLGGAARVAGLVGAFVAALNLVLSLGGLVIGMIA
jgi:hypothetical protein